VPDSTACTQITATFVKWAMTLLTIAINTLMILDARGYTFYWGTNAVPDCGAFVRVNCGTLELGLNTIEGNPFEVNRWLPVIKQRQPILAGSRDRDFSFYLSVPWIYEPWHCRCWTALITTACPTVALWLMQRKRHHHTKCAACGYSRDGLPVAAVCPECGMDATA
jgi:hypothetical protein